MPLDLYGPDTSYPGAGDHGATWAPTRFPAELSETVFMTEKAIEWLGRHGDRPFFMHISYVRPHPPRRNPAGYHDLYSADQVGAFTGFATPEAEAAFHPLNELLVNLALCAAPHEEPERRQLRATYYGAQSEVDDQLGRLFRYLDSQGLSSSTLVVLTSDHGEMGGDHWLVEKCGYWDESFHVPLIVRDPSATADATRGLVVSAPTESVDVAPTILAWLGVEIPAQFDGWPLTSFLYAGAAPERWRTAAHWEWDFRHPMYRYAEQRSGHTRGALFPGRGPHGRGQVRAVRGRSGRAPALTVRRGGRPGPRGQPGPGPTGAVTTATGGRDSLRLELEMAQEMLRWRMRNLERALSSCYLAPGQGRFGPGTGGGDRRPCLSGPGGPGSQPQTLTVAPISVHLGEGPG